MIPIFKVLSALGLYNSLLAIIISSSNPNRCVPYAAVLLSVPDELLEAARMDGAGEWKIYWSIILPDSEADSCSARNLLLHVEMG